MAEEKGHWVTINGNHVFISDTTKMPFRKNRARAEELFDQFKEIREKFSKFKMEASPQTSASVEAWEKHLDNLSVASEKWGFKINESKISFGASFEEIDEAYHNAAKKYKKRSGVRALVKKYGAQGASNIVFKHSGRRIRETPK